MNCFGNFEKVEYSSGSIFAQQSGSGRSKPMITFRAGSITTSFLSARRAARIYLYCACVGICVLGPAKKR